MKLLSSFSIALLLLSFGYVNSQTLKLVGEKEIFDVDFSNANQLKFQFSTGKSIGTYLGIPVLVEINKILESNSVDPSTTSILVSFENNTEVKYYTYFDFLNEITAIPPYLIIQQKIKSTLGDTVLYQTKGGKQATNMELSGLDEQIFGGVVVNVKLQFKSMDASEQQKIFSKTSLIFPVDKSPKQWLSDIKRIKVYRIE